MGRVVTLSKVSQSRRLARQASATINGMKVRGRQALSAIGSCINDVLAPSLRDSVMNLWDPVSPR